MERNVRIHGTLKKEAALAFNEHNAKVEAFTFIGSHAIPPKNTDGKFESKIIMIGNSSDSDHAKTKNSNSMDSKNIASDLELNARRREKGKTIMTEVRKDLTNP